MFGILKRKRVGHVPKYIDYNGNPHSIDRMSVRHLRNAIKGFRRKGYVPTWEYQKGKNRPMGVMDFLIRELEQREKDAKMRGQAGRT
jgi:hypothetical protein